MATSAKTEQRAFLLLLGILVIVVSVLLYPFLNAITLSVVLAVLFQPLHKKFLQWTNQRTNLSALFSVLSIVVFLLLPLAAFLTLLTTQLSEFVGSDTSAIKQTQEATTASVSFFTQYLQQKLLYFGGKFEHWVGFRLDLVAYLHKEVSHLAQTLTRYSPQMISETANFFVSFFIMLILLFYLFRDGKSFVLTLIRITPVKDKYERKLAAEIHKTIDGVFYGSFLMAIIQGVLAGLGFFVLGIEGYMAWGALTFFTSFLPSIGTGAIFIPMICVLFLQGKTLQAVILAVYFLAMVGCTDYILRPRLMHSNVHPMFLFLSIFGGLAVFGPIGLLLGPLFMALTDATIRIYAEDFVETKI